MAKIFSIQSEINEHPNRNNFDLSHKVHMTGKMGVLYPVLCKPVVPGDTFRIESGCAFNFMPMPYPTQTRMRFIMHYFYVRNKNLWKNWENWLQGLPDNDTGEDIVPPYIDQPVDFYKTGSLADFLGIPTTIKVDTDDIFLPGTGMDVAVRPEGEGAPIILMSNHTYASTVHLRPFTYYNTLIPVGSRPLFSDLYCRGLRVCSTDPSTIDGNDWEQGSEATVSRFYDFNIPFNTVPSEGIVFGLSNPLPATTNTNFVHVSFWRYRSNQFRSTAELLLVQNIPYSFGVGDVVSVPLSFDLLSTLQRLQSEETGYNYVLGFSTTIDTPTWEFTRCSLESNTSRWPTLRSHANELTSVPAANPYYSSNNTDDTVKISALPFRAYESIYNAFYRNTHGVQPFMIDGRVQYNRYNTSLEGGADTTNYRLFSRNWELDAYTSCLPSPQQGNAPLVGISSLGRLTVVDPDTGDTSTAQLTETNDGIKVTDVNLASEVHARYIINMANSGISINDFRQVNALQRFLETNIRKGFRYVDFIEGHFGHRIKDSIMDMPEFIGGFSENVNVGMITNTTSQVDSDDNQLLGSYGGQAAAFGGSSHNITHFCDDYGFIMGILCLVPDPTYSQILPKHFFNMSPFDYYFPEFAQIGMQPITYQEVCPIQSHYQHQDDPNVKLTDVFGYQRPNHDLVWYMDTLHGEFRKTFSDFIINRIYSSRPELGDEFLRIKPEETNSIFNYLAPDNDVFVGQLAFDIKAKRPVPRVVIPGLGR